MPSTLTSRHAAVQGLEAAALQQLVAHTLFETYGTFDWHVSYKRLQRESRRRRA